jgi:hypothetical protein
MRITDVQTFLVSAAHPASGTEGVTSRHWDSRNWCFVKIFTDEGIYGVGESSGWPRVIETAIHDLKPLLIGEDPFLIERLWHKMLAAMMGHGMLGVVGHGALTGIEVRLEFARPESLELIRDPACAVGVRRWHSGTLRAKGSAFLSGSCSEARCAAAFAAMHMAPHAKRHAPWSQRGMTPSRLVAVRTACRTYTVSMCKFAAVVVATTMATRSRCWR